MRCWEGQFEIELAIADDLHDGENNISFIANALKRHWRDHYNHEVEDPVGTSRQSVGGGTDTQRNDLSGVQPGHTEPTDGEECVEDKEEDGLPDTGLGIVQLSDTVVCARKDSHRYGHTRSTEQHEWATADLFDDEDRYERSHEVFGSIASCEKLGHVRSREANLAVELWCIVGDEVDTRDLLENLIHVREHDSVELAVLCHLEKTAVRALGHFHDCFFDVVELSLDQRVAPGLLIESLEDLVCGIILAVHDKPTRGLGQIANRSEDDDGKKDLEGQGKSPGDFTFADPCET